MSREIGKLSARKVQTLAEPGLHPDGGGLYLQITPAGVKSWIFRFRWLGKRPVMGLGPLHAVSLAEARKEAGDARRALSQGIDPRSLRNRPTESLVPTFKDAADDYIEAMRPGWKNKKHVQQWENTLATYCKRLMSKPVNEIGTDDVVACLAPIWVKKAETAGRVRGRIENILDAVAVKAREKGFDMPPNPARWKGQLQHLLPKKPTLQRGHFPALPYNQMADFMPKLRAQKGQAARALEWLIVTASRPGEVRFATRDEIKGDLWNIPADRMKGYRAHVEPLSSAALAMVPELPKEGLLFPNAESGDPLSENAMRELLIDMGYKGTASAHGFRSTFKDWASEETEVDNVVSEMALAHKIKDKAEAAYRRGKLLERRRRLMEEWGQFCGYEAPKAAKAQPGANSRRIRPTARTRGK